ncbi:MAG: beta-lactamase family protein, partial [Gemmatimonadota bacterium]|nr:beta-lactamase family protein [Gemmatimonadota bacterium]
MTRRTWLATGSAMLATACAAGRASGLQSSSSSLQPPASSLDNDLPRWMRLASVPGVSLAIIERDRVTARGFGVTRAGGTQLVDADTVFEAASLSKPVFAYLVLRLAADGAIDLDRPLAEYLPLPNPSDAASRPITARHALSHATGWRNWRNTREHALTADFTPGSRFEPLGMRRSAYMSRPDLEVNRAEPHSNRGVPIESFNTRVSR